MAKHPDTVWPQLPDTVPVDRKGSHDVIGDDQAERFGFASEEDESRHWIGWLVLIVLTVITGVLVYIIKR